VPSNYLEKKIISRCGKYRRNVKALTLWLSDMIFFLITLPLALFVRLDFHPPSDFVFLLFSKYMLIGVVCFTLASVYMKTYSTIIRLANLNTAIRIAIAALASGASFYIVTNHILRIESLPRSIFLIQVLLFIPLAITLRFSFRLFERLSKFFEEGVPTIIYGAGRTTNIFLPAMLKPASGIKVVGLIDDDPNKRRGEVQGVPVLGSGEDLSALVKKHLIEQVIVCMPTLDGLVLRKLISRLRDLSVIVKVAPEANSYISTNVVPEKIGLRDLNIEDLLKRAPRKVDQAQISTMIEGQNVLVTGGGGSIGSELCRQIIEMKPMCLFINDSSEFNLYTIMEELLSHNKEVKIIQILGDLSHSGICDEIFRGRKIDLIFHAAAYKHVPLVEENVNSALENNIVGTYNLFKQAWIAETKRVVLVSSDKAVNPTNVMGATKRACELIGQWFNQQNSKTIFSAVRFGNVLGSSGSVIPKFLKQIRDGGPVSITHPDITRFFMLIPEAVSLVLQASRTSDSGDIYVLDMGEPVKILDLAKDLLGIMGLKEGIDIEFEFTGLRPGEKMFEELYLGDEALERVSSDFYKVVNNDNSLTTFYKKLQELITDLHSRSHSANRVLLFDLINSQYELKKSAKLKRIDDEFTIKNHHSIALKANIEFGP